MPATSGPVFTPAPQPAQSRRPLPRKGRTAGTKSALGPFYALVNTFEGGTNGTTLVAGGGGGNTGGTSGTAFDTVTIGAGATDAFDTTHAAHGTLANKIATGSSATVFNTWSPSMLPAATVWVRLYLYFTANPTNQHRVFAATSGSTLAGSLQVTTGGKLAWADSSGSVIFTTATAIPTNAWFRVEGFITGSGSAGQVGLSLYTTPDLPVPVESYTSPATQSTTGVITDVRFGVSSAVASVGPYWQDDIGVSTLGALGPAVTPLTGGGSSSITCGQAAILPGTGATLLFPTPPGNCSVTFYNLGSTSAWIGTSTAVTSSNGMLCSSVPTTYQAYTGSAAATFYGTTGSTVSTSVATIQYIVVTDH